MQVPIPSETIKVEESPLIIKAGRTVVGSSRVVVVEVGVAREDSRPTVRVGAVYERHFIKSNSRTDMDEGQYREKTVAKVYVFEGEYALREALFYAECQRY